MLKEFVLISFMKPDVRKTLNTIENRHKPLTTLVAIKYPHVSYQSKIKLSIKTWFSKNNMNWSILLRPTFLFFLTTLFIFALAEDRPNKKTKKLQYLANIKKSRTIKLMVLNIFSNEFFFMCLERNNFLKNYNLRNFTFKSKKVY